jgi:hypothetical protein
MQFAREHHKRLAIDNQLGRLATMFEVRIGLLGGKGRSGKQENEESAH